jgi:hypothetical protein
MNKFYIPEIYLSEVRNIPNLIDNLNEKYFSKKTTEKQILTTNGLYKIIDDDIIQFKLVSKNSNIIQNFYKNLTLIEENIYEKKIGLVTYIPYENETIEITKIKYSIQERSEHFLVLELINNRIKDLYFISSKNIGEENLFFKNDLCSFIDSLNV